MWRLKAFRLELEPGDGSGRPILRWSFAFTRKVLDPWRKPGSFKSSPAFSRKLAALGPPRRADASAHALNLAEHRQTGSLVRALPTAPSQQRRELDLSTQHPSGCGLHQPACRARPVRRIPAYGRHGPARPVGAPSPASSSVRKPRRTCDRTSASAWPRIRSTSTRRPVRAAASGVEAQA